MESLSKKRKLYLPQIDSLSSDGVGCDNLGRALLLTVLLINRITRFTTPGRSDRHRGHSASNRNEEQTSDKTDLEGIYCFGLGPPCPVQRVTGRSERHVVRRRSRQRLLLRRRCRPRSRD
jgi:hypothetical protein